jgi:hypothetical protein
MFRKVTNIVAGLVRAAEVKPAHFSTLASLSQNKSSRINTKLHTPFEEELSRFKLSYLAHAEESIEDTEKKLRLLPKLHALEVMEIVGYVPAKEKPLVAEAIMRHPFFNELYLHVTEKARIHTYRQNSNLDEYVISAKQISELLQGFEKNSLVEYGVAPVLKR